MGVGELRTLEGLPAAVLTAHPDVPGTASDLIDMYFEKDVVEKDFQTIKSAVELRPVHHQTDIKLRAHVTICMLALLLQRILAALNMADLADDDWAAAYITPR